MRRLLTASDLKNAAKHTTEANVQSRKPERGFDPLWPIPWPSLLLGSALPSTQMTASTPASSTPPRTSRPPVPRPGFSSAAEQNPGQSPGGSQRCGRRAAGAARCAQVGPVAACGEWEQLSWERGTPASLPSSLGGPVYLFPTETEKWELRVSSGAKNLTCPAQRGLLDLSCTGSLPGPRRSLSAPPPSQPV